MTGRRKVAVLVLVPVDGACDDDYALATRVTNAAFAQFDRVCDDWGPEISIGTQTVSETWRSMPELADLPVTVYQVTTWGVPRDGTLR